MFEAYVPLSMRACIAAAMNFNIGFTLAPAVIYCLRNGRFSVTAGKLGITNGGRSRNVNTGFLRCCAKNLEKTSI